MKVFHKETNSIDLEENTGYEVERKNCYLQ